jgi:hypothetical protein
MAWLYITSIFLLWEKFSYGTWYSKNQAKQKPACVAQIALLMPQKNLA